MNKENYINGELHNFYSSSVIITVIISISARLGGRTCSTHGGDGKIIQSATGKPQEKRPLGNTSGRWKDNIRI
jgi:hypothetical protein